MKVKLRDILEAIDEEELYKLKNDLTRGGVFLRKLVEDKIKAREGNKTGYCITCGEDLAKKGSSYSLIFGPDDFRKKAQFCEVDCLEYFISGLKKVESRMKGENNAV